MADVVKWEYRVLHVSSEPTNMEPRHRLQVMLNDFGQEGWELVTALSRDVDGSSDLLFKRRWRDSKFGTRV